LVSWLKSGNLEGIPTDITDTYDRLSYIDELVQNDARVKAHKRAQEESKVVQIQLDCEVSKKNKE
jgi:hypothetical protein